jgi:outer membrane protein assembly factor BamB
LQKRRRLLLLLAIPLALLGASVIPSLAAPTSKPTAGCVTLAVTYQISVSHDGCSSDSTIVPPLAQRWSRDFTGPVSYPLIAEGKVFVTVADIPNFGSGTTLYALDQASGATLWSQVITGTFKWSNAAYDAGRVFVVNGNGQLRAFDAADGVLQWETQLPGQRQFSSPPTADGGVVYTVGAFLGGTLYAARESDGAVLWTQPLDDGHNSSPALSATDVFVAFECSAYAFDRTTGQPRWSNNDPCSGGGGKTAVYHAGRVYSRDSDGNEILDASTGDVLGTFQANPAPAFAGKIGLFLNGSTLQATSGHRTLWTFSGDGRLDSAPIVVGTTAFVGSSSGMLYGLDLRRGRVVWSTNVGAGIPRPDEQNLLPLTGLGAGQGLLVVPAGNRLAAYGS